MIFIRLRLACILKQSPTYILSIYSNETNVSADVSLLCHQKRPEYIWLLILCCVVVMLFLKIEFAIY